MTEKLFKACQYREAEIEHKRSNPTAGDYWYQDMYVPDLVVLAVARAFITVCRTTRDVSGNRWTWDLSKPEILTREDFVNSLKLSHCGGTHQWVVNAFRHADPVPLEAIRTGTNDHSLYTDSQWLKSVGFIESPDKRYTLTDWLVITCDNGSWKAYSVQSSHWHLLRDVEFRDDVKKLVSALGLDG